MNLELDISLGRQNRAKKNMAAVFELGDNGKRVEVRKANI